MKSTGSYRLFFGFLLILAHHSGNKVVSSLSSSANSMMVLNSTDSTSRTWANSTIGLYSVAHELENSTLSQLGTPKLSKMKFTPQFVIHMAMCIVEGFVEILLNGLLIAGLLREKQLRTRKEYTPIGAMALCDAVTGYWVMAMAAYHLSLDGWQPTRLATALDCLLVPSHLFLIHAFHALQPVMFTVMSLDRLFAVAFPVKYFGWGMRYALALSGGAYMLVFTLFLIMGIVTVVSDTRNPVYKYSWLCTAGWALPKFFNFPIYNICWLLTSMLISVMFLVIFWFKNGNNMVVSLDEQIQKQIRITKTIGISAIITLVLFVTPSVALFIVRQFTTLFTQPIWLTLVMYGLFSMQLNSVIQPMIVIYRQKDIRNSVKKLLIVQIFLPKPVAPTTNQPANPVP